MCRVLYLLFVKYGSMRLADKKLVHGRGQTPVGDKVTALGRLGFC